MPKVSVIIPAYNIEEYIEKSVLSVTSQSYKDIEIIAVDDGSTDGTGEKLAELAKKDNRISIITQKNGGPSAARNAGLKVARGEYVWFLDGDDYMCDDAIAKMVKDADGYDMVVCNTLREFMTHLEGPLFNLPTDEQVNADSRIADYFLGKISIAEFTDNKLYRKAFLESTGVEYEGRDRIFAEDSFFLAKVLKTMGKIHIVNEVLVIYYQRPESETRRVKDNLAERCENFIEEISEWYDHEYDFEIKTRAFRFFYDIIYNDANNGYSAFAKAVKNKYFRKKIRGMDQSTLTSRQRLIVKMLDNPMVLYSIIRKRGVNMTKPKEERPDDIFTSQTKELSANIRTLDRKNTINYVANTVFVQAIKRSYKRIISFAVAVFIVMLAINVTFISKSQTMILRCNYSEAAKGFYPDGTWFDIFEIKSGDVLSKVCEDNNIVDYTVREMQNNVSVFAINDNDIIEKAVNANTEGTDYYYVTNEYNVTYTQKNKFAKNEAFDMLEYISEAYTELFFDNYTEKNTILEFDRDDVDFEDLEYVEIGDWFQTLAESFQYYITDRVSENPSYRSEATDQTFINIQKMLSTFISKDLAQYKAYVSQSGLAKDKSEYINKLEYKNDNLLKDQNKYQLAHDFRVNAIGIYDSYITGVAFIPSIDSKSEFYMNRTKTGIDYLTSEAYTYGIYAENYEKVIQSNNTIINNLNDNGSTGSEYTRVKANADDMISSMCTTLEEISRIALETDNDYINYKTMNYLEFIIPEHTVWNVLLPHLALAVTVLAAGMVTLIIWIEAMISTKLLLIKTEETLNKEEEENDEKEGE